ncbi:MAG: Gfo/Idh/MocA family oxidoreductase [Alphaproteobacteria bacterium]|nr:Gfo/Idh/MocA family oxidoreductase [Alphaproteobacteria bacterium]
MTQLRAGIIGLGVGEQHIAGYRLHRSCEVVAVADLDPAKQAMAHEKYPELRVYGTAEALIDAPDIDVVSIASYDDDHFAQVLRAITTGKHVFAEKPLCWTEKQLATLRQALARQSGIRLSSNLILRLSPRFVDVRQRVLAGEFGRLFHIEADYNYGRLEKITSGWRARQDFYSVMLGGGIHMIDLVTWLTGDRVDEVTAYGNAIASAGTPFRFNDMALAILRWKSGMTGKVAANFACVQPHFHRLLVYGTAASFENREEHGLLWRSRDRSQPPEAISTAYPGIAKGALIPSFVDGILGNGTPVVDEDAVFETMSVCLAVERSMREGRPVPVTRF